MERNEPPRWLQDKHFNEVLFCEDFLSAHPMVCVDGSFFTVEGRVTDEEGIRKQIYEMLRPHFTSGTARRATGLLETLRLEAYTPELPIQEDRIHVANGTLFLNGEFRAEKEFCRNRLPVNYDPTAPQPETWLRFLSDLLEAEDILTLQEYLGYCLIPTNRGQAMMLFKGNGGEGKSRIGVVMQKLLGSNLKNGSIAKVERSPFARADLEHELLMVDDDMKLEALQSTHYLKSLITAEMPMDLERKGEQSYRGRAPRGRQCAALPPLRGLHPPEGRQRHPVRRAVRHLLPVVQRQRLQAALRADGEHDPQKARRGVRLGA